jgi:PAS domain S-box-containing protein
MRISAVTAFLSGIAILGFISIYAYDAAVGDMETAEAAAARSVDHEMEKGGLIHIDDALASINVGPCVDYLEDRSGRLTIGDVASDKAPRFHRNSDPVINFGLTESAYWLRFTVMNTQNHEISSFLMIAHPILDEIRFYEPDGRGGYSMKKTGDIYPFNQREIENANFVFPMKLKPGQAKYYLRIVSVNALTVPLMIMSKDELYRTATLQNIMQGLYYGMLIIMLVYNLFIFISVRGREYLYYMLYLSAFTFLSLSLDGFGAQYVWRGIPQFSISSFPVFLANVMCLLFTREFMETGTTMPRLDIALRFHMLLCGTALAINFLLMNSFIMTISYMIFTPITVSLILLVMVFSLRQGMRSAVFFTVSWSVMAAGVIIYLLRVMAVLPATAATFAALKLGLAAQLVIFSFGLSDRINTMKKRLENLNVKLEKEVLDHVRDKKALQLSEERFRGVVERNFDVIFILSTEGRFTFVSPSVTVASGYRPDELVSRQFKDFLPEDMHEVSMLLFGDLLKGKEVIGFETPFYKKDGTRISIEINLSPIMIGGEVTGIQGVARDITERKLAEEAIMEEKERLSITLRSIAEGVIATDIKWRVRLMNKVAEDLTGWRQEEVLGKVINDVLQLVYKKTGARKDFTKSDMLYESTVDLRPNTVLVSRDKTERSVSGRTAPIRDRSGKILGYVIVIRDITDEVKFHNELMKIEKLESIGILAGGIAHDFNNLLTAIMGNVNLARLITEDNFRLNEILDDAEKASKRAQELTQQFLTFAKGGAPVRQIASIEDIIKDSSSFILRGSDVLCTFNFQEKIWPVNVDVGQLSQVIQNLVINADQAMPDGGDITIATENVVMTPESNFPLSPGRYVRISVRDTGIGIPPENIPRIFDPYFSTKSDGNGLGLTSTYSIIKRHEGHISVESQVGKGTTFYVYLPTSDTDEEAAQPKYKSTFRGKGRVLFMDDDEAVNATSKKMLEYLGFTVEIALDGDRALELYRRSMEEGAPFDLVILDLTIPGGMGGKKTIEKLIALDKNINAIVSSGYSNDMIMSRYHEFGFKGVIAKPYRIDELARVVEQVMGRK